MDRSIYVSIRTTRAEVICCIALLAFALGCGKGESPDTAAANEPKSQGTAATATPDATVHEFMTAFKHGDDAKAAELLTVKARQEAERTGKAISPPGSKTMQFKVGEVAYVSEAKDGAHVACRISDSDPEGQETAYDVVWFLRKEAPGWRVAGVAMKLFEDELPVLYNFEDQDDMDRKMELVEQEMVRRSKETIMQAQQPPAEGARKQ